MKSSHLYACKMCPETAFKWQSGLYKHFLINHFNEQIRSMLPASEPYKCPKCEYVAKAKYALLVHVGIAHKMVLTLLEQAAEKGQNLIVKAVHKEENTPSKFNIVQPILVNANENLAFQCPFCPLKVSFGLRRNHLAKHFYAQLSAEVAEKSPCSEEPPFSCYLCRHVALDRNSLIKHVGVTHKVVDQFIKDSNVTLEDSAEVNDITPPPQHGVECRLCDKPQSFR